jgi:hypothetical protein
MTCAVEDLQVVQWATQEPHSLQARMTCIHCFSASAGKGKIYLPEIPTIQVLRFYSSGSQGLLGLCWVKYAIRRYDGLPHGGYILPAILKQTGLK